MNFASRTAEQLESQNDEAIEGLSAKVKMLKEVSFLNWRFYRS